MRLTKENVYIDLRGKSKDELTELYRFLKSVGEKLYAYNLTWFLEYSNSKNNVFVFHYNKRVWLNPKREYVTNKQEVTIEQLKEILQPMENKEYLLITEDGYEVKEKENVSWIIKDEYKYELTLCETHKTLIENSEGVYKVFKIKEKALEYHNKMLLSKNINLPLTEQLQKAEAEVKRLQSLIEEENKPKIGDICKFWDDGKNDFIIGKLECSVGTEIYPYEVHGVGFENCEKITDENFLKAFNNL